MRRSTKKAMLIEKVAEVVKKKKEKKKKPLRIYERIYGVEGPSTDYAKGRMEYEVPLLLTSFSPDTNRERWAASADEVLDKKLRKETSPYRAYGQIDERTFFPGKLQSRHKTIKRNLEQSGVREDIIKARKVDPAKELEAKEASLAFATLGAVGILLATEMGLRASPEAAEKFAKEVVAAGKTGLSTVALSSAPLSIPGLAGEAAGQVTILRKPSVFNLILGGPHYMPSDSMIDKLQGKILGRPWYDPRGHIVATPNLGVLSHELGHATNRQWVSKTFGAPGRVAQTMGYIDLGSLPIIGRRIPKPIRSIPILGLAALPLFSEGFTKAMKGKDKDSIRYKVFEKIEKNPEIFGTALLFPKLVEEAAATGHGLAMVHKWGAKKGKGLVELGKALASMLPAFATYALAAGGGYAALRALGKFRRAKGTEKMEKITRPHEKAMEKMKKLIK